MHLILDTETNARQVPGKKWNNYQEIIELGYYFTDKNFDVLEEYETLVSDVADEIYEFQKVYTLEDIQDGVKYSKVFDDLYEKMITVRETNGKVIAHNLEFDSTVILHSAEVAKIDIEKINEMREIFNKNGFCTCKTLPKKVPLYFPNGKRRNFIRLQDWYSMCYPNKKFVQTHTALSDVKMLHMCIKKTIGAKIFKL